MAGKRDVKLAARAELSKLRTQYTQKELQSGAQLMFKKHVVPSKGAYALHFDCITRDEVMYLQYWLENCNAPVDALLNIRIENFDDDAPALVLTIRNSLILKIYNYKAEYIDITVHAEARYIQALDIKVSNALNLEAIDLTKKPSSTIDNIQMKIEAPRLYSISTYKVKGINEYILATPRLHTLYFQDKNNCTMERLVLLIQSECFKEMCLDGKPELRINNLITTQPHVVLKYLYNQCYVSIKRLGLVIDFANARRINIKDYTDIAEVHLPAPEYLTRYKRVLCNLTKSNELDVLPQDAHSGNLGEITLLLPAKAPILYFTSMTYIERYLGKVVIGNNTKSVVMVPYNVHESAVSALRTKTTTAPLVIASVSKPMLNILAEHHHKFNLAARTVLFNKIREM